MRELILIEDLGMMYPKKDSNRKLRFGLYKCFCGNEFKAMTQSIKSNKRKSCGCLVGARSGQSKERLYNILRKMKERCYSENSQSYKFYGEKGITICNEWLMSYSSFKSWALLNGYDDNLQIDRKDNDGNYEPSNCRWVNRNVQARNTRLIMVTNSSGYRGVSFDKKSNKWVAKITVDGKAIYIGRCDDKIESAKLYDNYVIDNNLEHTINGII